MLNLILQIHLISDDLINDIDSLSHRRLSINTALLSRADKCLESWNL